MLNVSLASVLRLVRFSRMSLLRPSYATLQRHDAAGLWPGHLLCDLPWIVVIVFGAATSQFYALRVFWDVYVV